MGEIRAQRKLSYIVRHLRVILNVCQAQHTIKKEWYEDEEGGQGPFRGRNRISTGK